jgi:hypothetical protein
MYPRVSEAEIDMTCAQLAYTLEKEAEEAELVSDSLFADDAIPCSLPNR